MANLTRLLELLTPKDGAAILAIDDMLDYDQETVIKMLAVAETVNISPNKCIELPKWLDVIGLIRKRTCQGKGTGITVVDVDGWIELCVALRKQREGTA